MPLNISIEKASAIAGSQRALAQALGARETHLSNWKKGSRPCTIETRARIAEMAGDDPYRAIIEGLIAQLDPNVELQAGAAAMLQSMLDAFPTDHSSIIRRNQRAKNRQLYTTRRRRRRGHISRNGGLCNIKQDRQLCQGHTSSTKPKKLNLLQL